MAVRHARGRHQHLASVRAYHGAVVHLLTHTAMDTSQHDSAQLQAQADAGDRGAQYKLATLHRKGAPGIPRDLDKAATLYALAAEQGHVEATFQVGMAYQEGAGVVKDLGQAAKWFARAAGKGHARAQYQMGQACAQGRGGGAERDGGRVLAPHGGEAEAPLVANAAGDRILPGARRGEGCRGRQGVLGAGAHRGNKKAARAVVQLAEAEAEGITLDAPWLFSVERERKRADAGDVDAQRMMAFAYKRGGGGVEQNETVAAQWYGLAAAQGDAEAQLQMGQACAKGVGVEKGFAGGRQLLHLCCQAGSRQGSVPDGTGLRTGQGVEKNLEQAAKWFAMAAEQGHDWAQCKLGAMYEKGEGVLASSADARAWYARAAENGNPKAAQALKEMQEAVGGGGPMPEEAQSLVGEAAG